MKSNIIISIVIAFSMMWAGTEGTIRGNVSNMEGENLVGAQIYIEELGIGAVADPDGNYILLNVPVGTYDVTATMISYATKVYGNVAVIMDNTVWLNITLEVEALEGDVIYVSGEKALVEKGSTAKKITIGEEAIEALPIRDVSELYSLQSGVVKVEGGMRGGIPDHEEKGLEEVHVRGGRSGEIAYLIDGMYIRNPIYGGIGNGTRLNLFAVKEFDWQPGGFNAEYGDAMSAVSNYHTASGGKEFAYKFKYETSLVGAAMGNAYDELRGYNDYNLGFGGTVPLLSNLKYWVSGQYTNYDNYRVFKFDDKVYDVTDRGGINNKLNAVQPWDSVASFRGFGLDNTWDVFGKLTYKFTSKLRFNLSYWNVAAHRKGFSSTFLYWDEGQNELFRDTRRIATEINHSISPRTFYSLRFSQFEQQAFLGVRLLDSDADGYPDWFEWSHGAGERTNGEGNKQISDPYNPFVVPYSSFGDSVFYTRKDGNGPEEWTSGWYFVDNNNDGLNDIVPGNYNWDVAEPFNDINRNGVYDEGVDEFKLENDFDNNGVWTGPTLVEEAEYRDGSYWLTPEMYVDFEDFLDTEAFWNFVNQDPYVAYGPNAGTYFTWLAYNSDSLYFLPSGVYEWQEGRAFGGHDRLYQKSNALTNEMRFDLTSQLTDKWRARVGIDLKSHKLNFYQVTNPWDDVGALRQRFAEQWDDFGADGVEWQNSEDGEPDPGEGNGRWDAGEVFDDFNGNGKWDNFVEPVEVAGYFQNTFEVPWMVINAGVRVDAVNYNSKIWSDPEGNFSPTKPWFWEDCGVDGYCAGHNNSDSDIDGDYSHDPDVGENDGIWNYNEKTTDDFGAIGGKVFFRDSEWQYKLSPRIGVSHVITDQSTFTFNYGIYYQTPVYENIYLNTNRQEDPQEVIEESAGYIGNATMTASRTQSYEFGFNVQVGRNWAYSVAGWVKDMDRLTSSKTYRSMLGEYSVATNGDYGTAKGIDLTLENRGQLINTTIQYTYSKAKANGEYDQAAFGNQYVDAPTQEFTMPFDRPHDLTVQLYTFLPFGINASLTGFYQSGIPYTGMLKKGDGEPYEDLLNKYSKRTDSYQQINISFSKYVTLADMKIALGLNVFNLANYRNILDVFPETGHPQQRSEYFTKDIGLPEEGKTISNSYYDNPWHYSSPREFNFFIRIDYK
ncbi:MAG: carboxypeptidase regulatory-like domain-containing protein [Candidatus Marinimicrobia bacterium]|nr:carboxypeptidase regulatory-like domain-containing protein [Candidatus Neomarinimicrobiota bacterium]